MEKSLESLTKWLKKSGLKVNNNKTELCLFYKNDTAPITITLEGVSIKSANIINVLGVLFDVKLSWTPHIYNTIAKASKSLNALKLIRKFFNTKEFLMLLTSIYYSILYYNCEVWIIESATNLNKKLLLTASSNSLKVAFNYRYPLISHAAIHKLAKRATPSMFSMYKLALLLHNIYNTDIQSTEWIMLNLNHVFTSRQKCFHINKQNRLNVGMNALSNRLHFLNDKIPFEWLNKSFSSFKIECKRLFLS